MSLQTVDNLAEFRAQAVDEISDEAIVLKAGKEEFRVDHPLLMEDDQYQAILDARGNIATAKAILGEEAYERFKAAGGRSGDVLLAWRKLSNGTKS